MTYYAYLTGFESTYKELKHDFPGLGDKFLFCFESTYKELKHESY